MKLSDLNTYKVVSRPTPVAPPAEPQKDLLTRATDIATIIPGTRAIGESIGTAAFNIGQLAQGKTNLAPVDIPKTIGGYLQAGSLPASLGIAAPASVIGAAGQYGSLGAVSSLGASMENGNDPGEALKDTLTGGAVGAGLGATFNLLGKGITALAKKTGPSALSFSSGVPKNAIERAAQNPQVARQGLDMNVNEIRSKAVSSLQTLHNDLGKEFEVGLKAVTNTTGQTKAGVTFNQKGFIKGAKAMQSRLTEYSRDFAREFRLGTKASPEGILISFEKSPITSPGEQRAVQETFKTISTWDDFSAKGLQDLAERVGSLRKFESGAKTESSAIVSKIYNKITGAGGQGDHGLISKFYPELAELRTNYAKNRKILDEIGDILSADKKNPVAIQSSVTRLDNLFKQNKDEYLNIIRQLGERSGIDYLSLLAGGEFQKVLPNFIRGLGGGAAVSVGASILNPYLLLLAPLFSPRAVGAIVRNAPAVAKTTSQLTRAATTQAIQQTVPEEEQPQAQ